MKSVKSNTINHNDICQQVSAQPYYTCCKDKYATNHLFLDFCLMDCLPKSAIPFSITWGLIMKFFNKPITKQSYLENALLFQYLASKNTKAGRG